MATDHVRYDDELFSVLNSLGLSGAPPRKEDPTEHVEIGDEDKETTQVTSTAAPSTVTAKNCFRHPEAHPLVLDLILLRRFGPEFLGWEGETLEEVIGKEFSTTVSHVNFSKIQACRTLHLVDSFWERWEVFSPCTMALNGTPPDFEIMQASTVAEAAVAVDIANRIRTDVLWSEEIKGYISTLLRHDEIYAVIPPLDFVPPPIAEVVNTAEILQRWSAVRASGKPPTGDTIEDEQLRRLLVVYDYVSEHQSKLRDQLGILRNV